VQDVVPLAQEMGGQYNFEWDSEKARANLRKHGVSFEQASRVLEDPSALSIYDDTHSSTDEDRWITLGRAGDDVLVVVHTFREMGPEQVTVRIISARQATRHERRQYEGAGGGT
jgi:uncharacterized protein